MADTYVEAWLALSQRAASGLTALREQVELRLRIVEELLRHKPITVGEHEWKSPEEESGYRLALGREADRLTRLLTQPSSNPPQQDREDGEISPDEAAERITRELRAHPDARWDRFIQYGGKARVYGWLDRPDGRADFLLLDFDSHTGELLEWITSAHPHPASVVERLENDDSVFCQRVEDCFDVPNAVRLTQPEADPEVPGEDEFFLRATTPGRSHERAVELLAVAQKFCEAAVRLTQPVSESPGDSGEALLGRLTDAAMEEPVVVAALDKFRFDGCGYSVATANRMREALNVAIAEAWKRANPGESSS